MTVGLRPAAAVADGPRVGAGALGADLERAGLAPGRASRRPRRGSRRSPWGGRSRSGGASSSRAARARRRRARPRRRSSCPPMSTHRRSGSPFATPTAAPPITPPAGPDARMRTGRAPQVLARHHAAARLHDEELAREPRLAQAVRQAVEVARHARADVRVHDRRAGALELRRLRHHLVGERDRDARQASAASSPRRRSCTGFAKEKSRQIASDSTPWRAEALERARARRPRRGGCAPSRRRVAARARRSGAGAAARSAAAPGAARPRCPPCSRAAARARRGSPRWSGGPSPRRSSRSACCRRPSCRGRSRPRARGSRRGRAPRGPRASRGPASPRGSGRRASRASSRARSRRPSGGRSR